MSGKGKSIFLPASKAQEMVLPPAGIAGRSKRLFMPVKIRRMIMEYTFTKENFQAEVLDSEQPVLVDMFATWCGPCRMMGPVVEELAKEYEGSVKVGKLDIDENSDIAGQYGVMSVPTFLVFKNGQVAAKVVGAVPKEELKEAVDKAR